MQTPLKRVDTPQEANDEGVRALSNAALSAGAVALGSKFPTATGLGLAGVGAASGDPLATVGGGLMALFGAGGLAGKLGAKAAEKTEAGVLATLAKKALPAERQATAAGNRGAQRSLLERFKLLQGSTEPIRANTTPNAGTPNPDAQALGQLGSEVQENFRYLRSKDPLGLKLTPEAEAGTQAILPDYETQANQQLARFAQGKGARLEEIKRSLQEAANAPKPGAGPQSMLMDPKLLESNTLKPNPLAGFTPKPPPSLEEMAARLKDAGQPQAEIAAMRARQGIPERMAGLATKAVGLQGAMRLGDLSAAVKDPVLAHYLVKPAAKVLQSAPQIAARVLPFLRGAEGSVLLTKLRYLMKNDPQFADAMKAANEEPPNE
jgi:hypothetical protein